MDEILCDFCLGIVKAYEATNVKEMIIDRKPGYISFKSVLKIVFFYPVDATFICSSCFDSVMSHYIFREKIFKNLKLSQTNSTNPIQEVINFLTKISEPASIFVHQDVLSIVPNSLRNQFSSKIVLQKYFCPQITIQREDIAGLKQKLKQEVKSQQKTPITEVTEDIFGNDDYYVFLEDKSPTTYDNDDHKIPSDNKELIDDEALDTGESSNDCPSTSKMCARRKPKNIFNYFLEEENDSETELLEEIQCDEGDFIPEQRKRRYCKGKTSRLKLKRDLNMNESSLSKQQIATLKTLIKKSRFGDENYTCTICKKILNSRSAITYHIKHLHILKELNSQRLNETMWVSKKVKEGKRQINEISGIVKFEWHCDMCEKNKYKYPSHQGLRAHMQKHYGKIFKNEDSQPFKF